MHEWRITEAVVEEVLHQAKKNDLNTVDRVRLSVGGDVDLTPDAIKFCFQVLSKGTILEKTSLTIEKRDGRGITVESLEGEKL